MRFRLEQHFPGPLHRVESALVDPAFLARLSELPSLGQPTLLDQERRGHEIHQRVRYRFNGPLGGAVGRVVDAERLTWVEESVLDLATHLTGWRIVPDHYPHLLKAAGTYRLDPGPGPGAGTTRVAEGEVRVTVPLVGGSVEQAIVSGLHRHAAGEEEAVRAWLAEGSGSP